MTFPESIKTCFKKYADFNGTASRPEFWWFALFCWLATAVLVNVSQPLCGIFNLALLLPQLAVGARRLHDTGRSGWWWLIALVPVLGVIVLIIFWALPPKSQSSGQA